MLFQDLEMLDLRSNKLTTDGIGSNAFSELHQLQDLLLSDNKISRIHRSMFLGEFTCFCVMFASQ